MEKKEMITKFDFIDTDKRILDQKLRRHEVTHQEFQRILKSTPDDKDAADDLIVCKETVQES